MCTHPHTAWPSAQLISSFGCVLAQVESCGHRGLKLHYSGFDCQFDEWMAAADWPARLLSTDGWQELQTRFWLGFPQLLDQTMVAGSEHLL